ncbi:MAG: hypothetical protein QGG71_05520 [Pirellulaceae bacterium]|jgi:hypothetical protein|nr:hypothetical protein [Pirellulaceae bacterium]
MRANSPHPDHLMTPPDQSEWLTAGQLEAVRRWINRGALEYRLPDQCDIRRLTEIDFPSAKQCAACHPKNTKMGRRVFVTVNVISTVSGHNYPTGFTAERQLWVAIEVRGPTGRLVFASGDFDDNADLRDDHSYQVVSHQLPHDRHLLNFQNKFTALTDKGTERPALRSRRRICFLPRALLSNDQM